MAVFLVAVLLAAGTLLRDALTADGSAALTIRSTPSSCSTTWLRLRMTFFHLVTGIWSAFEGVPHVIAGDLPLRPCPAR